mmetsp:Transcript_25969/g.25786  ORF Transcript_25969/g.25786 Transcript_25969/m.25786 type:complete len:242 (-) Transcript_25969:116-841(-)
MAASLSLSSESWALSSSTWSWSCLLDFSSSEAFLSASSSCSSSSLERVWSSFLASSVRLSEAMVSSRVSLSAWRSSRRRSRSAMIWVLRASSSARFLVSSSRAFSSSLILSLRPFSCCSWRWMESRGLTWRYSFHQDHWYSSMKTRAFLWMVLMASSWPCSRRNWRLANQPRQMAWKPVIRRPSLASRLSSSSAMTPALKKTLLMPMRTCSAGISRALTSFSQATLPSMKPLGMTSVARIS